MPLSYPAAPRQASERLGLGAAKQSLVQEATRTPMQEGANLVQHGGALRAYTVPHTGFALTFLLC